MSDIPWAPLDYTYVSTPPRPVRWDAPSPHGGRNVPGVSGPQGRSEGQPLGHRLQRQEGEHPWVDATTSVRKVVSVFSYEVGGDGPDLIDGWGSQPGGSGEPGEPWGADLPDRGLDSAPPGKTWALRRDAALLADLISSTDPSVASRAKSVRPDLTRADAKAGRWTFKVPSSKPGDGPYTVVVQGLYEGRRTRALAKVDVVLSCSCGFWQWQGPEYWALQGGYLRGKPKGSATPPDIKDLDKNHKLCKHALRVLQLCRTFEREV